MFLAVLLYLTTLFSSALIIHRLHRSRQEALEQLTYAERRLYYEDDDPTGNIQLLDTLEWQVHRLNRRVTNLLQSPKLYLRARRIAGVLDMSLDELTAELEIVHIAEAEQALVAA